MGSFFIYQNRLEIDDFSPSKRIRTFAELNFRIGVEKLRANRPRILAVAVGRMLGRGDGQGFGGGAACAVGSDGIIRTIWVIRPAVLVFLEIEGLIPAIIDNQIIAARVGGEAIYVLGNVCFARAGGELDIV